MTRDELLSYIAFKNNEEKENANFYLDVKGVSMHIKVMNYLNFDFTEGSIIAWESISKQLRQDKCLRDKLYIYLATLEEYIRAYICNKYEDNPRQSFWMTSKKNRDNIKQRICNGEKLFDILQDIDLGAIFSQVKKLPKTDRIAMFGAAGTPRNLDAVRELRNAVSHHKFLAAHSFSICEVDGRKDSTLIQNIKNLRQLLPTAYRYGKNGNGGITVDMQKCGISI